MSFIVIPAVDILDSKCVRLEKGDYTKVTVYYENPVDAALRWENEGYKWLHIVDLDGAKFGQMKNLGIIKDIAKELKIPVEVGGGIRDLDTIKGLFDSGISRVIIGTIAFENISLVKTVSELYGDKIAVSIDAKRNIVLKKGWLEKTSFKAIDAAKRLVDLGIKRFVYTDVSKDGMMQGPNFGSIRKFAAAVQAKVIASGGVTTNADIEKLSKIKNVEGCIIGRAAYEGKILI
ncbi:MAG: 1-(5-phosphoribosyl)-5-[(5-phosphoribosylamino)methylideneamino]imidazole-4-carboxamide isomerase [Candidatus Saganbacteria bacterium]|nr:1-(5-phosphoribosyl)-5-[(5-phosphoribosylamino)methylideneamino]imidazole-4-carboxamide isomerase [Candidatus Saganbacteria bacterium]